MQFTFIFNFSFSPNPLPQSKEYQFCRHCSETGTLNGIQGSMNGGVGKTSKAPLLNPLLIYILHFASFWWLDVIFWPWNPSRVVHGSPLSGFVKWGNEERWTYVSAASVWRPSPVWEVRVKVGTIFSSSRLNPRLSWVGGHVSTIRACVHARALTHTCKVWPSRDSGYCLCGLWGGAGRSGSREIAEIWKNSGWERKKEGEMCGEDGREHEPTDGKKDR